MSSKNPGSEKPTDPLAAANAERQLRREEMTRFGDKLDWLVDPSLIPDRAADGLPGWSRYRNLSRWMLGRIVDWSAENQKN